MIDRIEAHARAEAGKAAEMNARHERYLWDAVIRYYETPLPLARGRGQYLYDYEGRISYYGTGLVEVPVEFWTYNFGPYKLMRRVRLVNRVRC